MILVPFFLLFNIIAIRSQYKRYQKLGDNAAQSLEPEEADALRRAQQGMIPNMVLLGVGFICLIGVTLYWLSAPRP